MAFNAGIVVFPGSNCDRDAMDACSALEGVNAIALWHKDDDLKGCDAVILPGGFSYGDYLRPGALAALAPVMKAIRRHAFEGGRVLGICNGFQILCEAGMLPGTLLTNIDGRFTCSRQHIRMEQNVSALCRSAKEGNVLSVPLANGCGRYYASSEVLASLNREGRVLFRYCDRDGSDTPHFTGSSENIAGVCNEAGNVTGMMPHPERATRTEQGSTDGLLLLRGFCGL